jgi:hypothetical protein
MHRIPAVTLLLHKGYAQSPEAPCYYGFTISAPLLYYLVQEVYLVLTFHFGRTLINSVSIPRELGGRAESTSREGR